MVERAREACQAYPTTLSRTWRARTTTGAAAAAALAGAMLAAAGPWPLAQAVSRTWPPFALVAGLLLIGRAADRDGLFAVVGTRLAHAVRRPSHLLFALLGVVATVTAVLNLDTAVVFLTPVLLHAARARRIDERPFVYGVIFMANSASLLLPGSNLTNVMVLGALHLPARAFLREMTLPWLGAVLPTAGAVWLAHGRRLPAASSTTVVRAVMSPQTWRAAAVVVAAAILVMLGRSLAVLLLGIAITVRHSRGFRGGLRGLVGAMPAGLPPLFIGAAAVGALARLVPASAVVGTSGAAVAVLAGAAGALALNNLPAAALISAHPIAHPLFALLGLDLGPNLFVTGSLSTALWFRVARQSGAAVSARRYIALGALVAPASLAVASLVLAVSGNG